MEKKCETEKNGVRLTVLLIETQKLNNSNPSYKLELCAKEEKNEWSKIIEDSLVSSITNQFLDSSQQLFELIEDCFLNKDASLSYDIEKSPLEVTINVKYNIKYKQCAFSIRLSLIQTDNPEILRELVADLRYKVMTQELEIVKLRGELKEERDRNAREIEILRSERANSTNSNGSPRMVGVTRSAEIPIEGGREPLIGARRSPSKDTLTLATSPQKGSFLLDGHTSPLSTSSGSWGRKASSFLPAQPQRGLLKELNTHTSDITSLYATPVHLFSGAMDGNIGMWDLPSGTFKKFLTSHKGKIVTMTSVGNTMLSVADDKVVRVWDMTRALCTQHKVLRRPRPASMTASLFMGSTLVTGASDGGIHVVDTSAGVTPRPIVDYAAHNNSQINCLMAQEGTIYSGAADGRIKHWRWADAHCLSEITAHPPGITAIAHTGTALCSAGLDGTVRLWSTSTNVSIQSLPLFNSLNSSGQISITNGTIASPAASPPGTPNINLPAPAPTHITCFFSVNSALYGGGSDGVVRRWGLNDGSVKTFQAHNKSVSSILVVDNQLVTAAVGGQIKIWDINML